jgi:hypothetical protein
VRARHSELDALTREKAELLDRVDVLQRENEKLRAVLDTTSRGNSALKSDACAKRRRHSRSTVLTAMRVACLCACVMQGACRVVLWRTGWHRRRAPGHARARAGHRAAAYGPPRPRGLHRQGGRRRVDAGTAQGGTISPCHASAGCSLEPAFTTCMCAAAVDVFVVQLRTCTCVQVQQLRLALLSAQQECERTEEMLRLQKAIAANLSDEVRHVRCVADACSCCAFLTGIDAAACVFSCLFVQLRNAGGKHQESAQGLTKKLQDTEAQLARSTKRIRMLEAQVRQLTYDARASRRSGMHRLADIRDDESVGGMTEDSFSTAGAVVRGQHLDVTAARQ